LLNDVQFERLEAHLPTDTRGKPRVDDRRAISGIVHVLLSGCGWKDAPAVYGPRKTLYNRFQRWAAKGVWSKPFHALASAAGPPAELLIDSSAVKAHRCALTDKDCRRIAFVPTGGHVPDCVAADVLLDQLSHHRSCAGPQRLRQ
jgi:transposase